MQPPRSRATSRYLELLSPREQPPQQRLHRRVHHGMRRPHNWYQLGRFLLVGLSGYVVNLAVFTFSLKVLSVHPATAATTASPAAVRNTLGGTPHGPFAAGEGHAGF